MAPPLDTPLLSGSSSRVFVAVQEMAGPRHGDHGERQHAWRQESLHGHQDCKLKFVAGNGKCVTLSTQIPSFHSQLIDWVQTVTDHGSFLAACFAVNARCSFFPVRCSCLKAYRGVKTGEEGQQPQ